MSLIPNFRNTTPTVRLAGGWQTGNPVDIARRYSPSQTRLRSNLNNISYGMVAPAGVPAPISTRFTPTAQTLPQSAAVSNSDDSVESEFRQVGGGQLTRPFSQPKAAAGIPPPPGNSGQRWASTKDDWRAAGGSDRTYNRANVARGVRSAIDARTTPAPQNARTDFDATFGANRSHMGTPSVTWEQRQANNQAGQAAAAQQRGQPELLY